MDSFQIIIILISVSILLIGVAHKMHLPYPIGLVIAGAIIGFIPGEDEFYFNPKIIIEVVLPPILYYGAFWMPQHEFKKNWKEIFSLAFGLVFATTIIAAALFYWCFPQFGWSLAFVFGAIISPPDAISAVTILKRFSIDPRLITILEGESLINDAFALLFYKLSVAALLTGLFSWEEGITEFVQIVIGGILFGLTSGLIIQLFSSRLLSPIVGVLFSFAIPYVIYFVADWLKVSGVLAVVINGLVFSRIFVKYLTSLRRVLSVIVWHLFIVVLNCFVFIIIGLQLRNIASRFTFQNLTYFTYIGLSIALAMFILRLVWVYFNRFVIYFNINKDERTHSYIFRSLKEGFILGYSGMRGIISLAIVLALPYNLPNGMQLVGRDEVIFITFVFILATLLVPGFTLSLAVRLLKIKHSDHKNDSDYRKQILRVAEQSINEYSELKIEERDFLLNYFKSRHSLLKIIMLREHQVEKVEQIRMQVFQLQREFLIQMWENGEITDKVLKMLELELDVEESLLIKMIRADVEI